MGVPEHSKARSSIRRSFERTKLRIFEAFSPALIPHNSRNKGKNQISVKNIFIASRSSYHVICYLLHEIQVYLNYDTFYQRLNAESPTKFMKSFSQFFRFEGGSH